MLYAVEIRRERDDIAKLMSSIRVWLDAECFEPDVFRSVAANGSVTFHLEFKIESEAMACAQTLGGQLLPGR